MTADDFAKNIPLCGTSYAKHQQQQQQKLALATSKYRVDYKYFDSQVLL